MTTLVPLLVALACSQTYGTGYCPAGQCVTSIPRNGPITCGACSGGGGGSYTLPAASPTVLGGVKVGSGLSMSGANVMSVAATSLSTLGGVKGGSAAGNVNTGWGCGSTMQLNGFESNGDAICSSVIASGVSGLTGIQSPATAGLFWGSFGNSAVAQWATVPLTSTTGLLSLSRGGTGSNIASITPGGVAYAYSSSEIRTTGAGTAGQFVVSAGNSIGFAHPYYQYLEENGYSHTQRYGLTFNGNAVNCYDNSTSYGGLGSTVCDFTDTVSSIPGPTAIGQVFLSDMPTSNGHWMPIGTSGKIMQANGTGADPTWVTNRVEFLQDENTALPVRNALNFTGAGISCADNNTLGNERIDCTVPNPTLNQVGNPTGDKAFTFPTGAKLLYTFTGSTDVAFSIDGDGSFSGTGDLMHVHKSGTGSSFGADALHVEVDADTNMTGIRVTMPSAAGNALTTIGRISAGNITATNFIGPLTGNVTGSANTISPAGTTGQYLRGDNTWASHSFGTLSGTIQVNQIAASTVTVAMINATGASATNFLRGDGVWVTPGGGGAPTTATYITQTADAGLSAEQALSSLGTGFVKVTTGTGVLTSVASINMLADTTADLLSIAKGGTGASTAPAGAGAVRYATSTTASGWTAQGAAGTILANSSANTPAWLAAGTAGQVLSSRGAAAPVYVGVQTCTSSASTTCTITVARSGCTPVCGLGGTANAGVWVRGSVSTTTLTCTFSASGTTTCNCLCP